MGYIVWFLCGWEFWALTLKRVGINWIPTISETVWSRLDNPYVVVAVMTALQWAWYHFFIERR